MTKIKLKFAQSALGRKKGDVEEFDSDDPNVQAWQKAKLLIGEHDKDPEPNPGSSDFKAPVVAPIKPTPRPVVPERSE